MIAIKLAYVHLSLSLKSISRFGFKVGQIQIENRFLKNKEYLSATWKTNQYGNAESCQLVKYENLNYNASSESTVYT